jgi:serine/threonine protein kinase
MSSQPRGNHSPEQAKAESSFEETSAFSQRAEDTGGSAGSTQASSSSAGVSGLAPRSLVGESFGDLQLLEEIGRGGMGLVFKARQMSLDRLVAVKLLLPEHFADPLKLARFTAEARAAASLDHPNIVQVYQVGECRFGQYFAMEYVDGQSLDCLIRKGNLSLAFTVHILHTVAKAVHFAHTKGIVHRDLKPANIMVDRARRPVVMDFGIVKFVGKPSSLTQQGVIVGTPAYMAPEQAGEAPDQVGPLSDVYSLGGILYSMLTSRVPYDGATPLQTILKVIGPDLPPPVCSLRPQVPVELERICMKCLSKRPADRYPSARALARSLRSFAATWTRRQAGSPTANKKGARTGRSSLPAVQLVAISTGKVIRVVHEKSVLGRASECDIIVRAADVSKQHCQILVEADRVLIEDLGSANGTFVNDRPVQQARLHDGDHVRVADHEFQVHLEPPEDNEMTR